MAVVVKDAEGARADVVASVPPPLLGVHSMLTPHIPSTRTRNMIQRDNLELSGKL
jgi:hypothetical protein